MAYQPDLLGNRIMMKETKVKNVAKLINVMKDGKERTAKEIAEITGLRIAQVHATKKLIAQSGKYRVTSYKKNGVITYKFEKYPDFKTLIKQLKAIILEHGALPIVY